MMKIASWNVNSIKARLDHVQTWLQDVNPDVLLLQELKGLEFPTETFRILGCYESMAVTQKAHNGVAILSPLPLEMVTNRLQGSDADTHSRFLEVIVDCLRIVNIYLPNGNPSVQRSSNTSWTGWTACRADELWLQSDIPTVVAGDWNVIPEDIDCHKPASWIGYVLFQPEPRARYRAMLDIGYADVFRSLHPGEKGQFTFWDYFRQAFENNRGIRIDHFLISRSLMSSVKSCEIDKRPRAQPKPSDHTPIILTLK